MPPVSQTTSGPMPRAAKRKQTPLSGLPPWDQATYYSIPTESSSVVGATAVRLVKGDPLRSHLQFGVIPNGAIAATGPLVLVSLNSNVAPTSGFALYNGSFPLTLSFDSVGPIVQQPWFAVSDVGGAPPFPIVTVQEMRFIRWPGRLGDPSVLQQVDDEQDNSEGCADRNRVISRINSNSAFQLSEDTDSDIRAAIESCQRGHQSACDRNVRMGIDGRRISLSLG